MQRRIMIFTPRLAFTTVTNLTSSFTTTHHLRSLVTVTQVSAFVLNASFSQSDAYHSIKKHQCIHTSATNDLQYMVLRNKSNQLIHVPLSSTKNEVVQPILEKSNLTLSNFLDPYWIEHIRLLQRPAAIHLISQLIHTNPLGLNRRVARFKGYFLDWLMFQKRQTPRNILISRVGEFYEAVGIDAIMLVEYCGLNPMGGKLWAGFPIHSIQDMLDRLTNHNFYVSVFEEINDNNASPGVSTKRKIRSLSQIVSPMTPLYLRNLLLKKGELPCRISKPAIGIGFQAGSGYVFLQVNIPLRTIVVEEQLTLPTLLSRIHLASPSPPLYIHLNGTGRQTHFEALLNTRYSASLTLQGIQRIFIRCLHDEFVSKILQFICQAHHDVSVEQFNIIKKQPHKKNQTHDSHITNDELSPQPLSPNMCAQLGLTKHPGIPNLLEYLLPSDAPFYSFRYLQEWIMTPPPYFIADTMQTLCRALTLTDYSISPIMKTRVVSLQKIALLLNAKQSNAETFREILANLKAAQFFMMKELQKPLHLKNESVLHPVWEILQFQDTINNALTIPTFLKRVETIIDIIEETVLTCHTDLDLPNNSESYSLFNKLFDKRYSEENYAIPSVTLTFSERNESQFRQRLRRETDPEIEHVYTNVEKALDDLLNNILNILVTGSFLPETSLPVTNTVAHNLLNKKNEPNNRFVYPAALKFHSSLNTIFFRPSVAKQINFFADKKRKQTPDAISIKPLIKAIDKRGQSISGLYTSPDLEHSISNYINAVNSAKLTIETKLRELNTKMELELPILTRVSAMLILLQTMITHNSFAQKQQWSLPLLQEYKSIQNNVTESYPFKIEGLWPYWLELSSVPTTSSTKDTKNQSDTIKGSPTDIDLSSIVFLTGPNMAGKSCLLRSVAVISVLASCGLYVPCNKAMIPRFDSFHLQMPTSDVPIEGRSSFAQEINATNYILRESTKQSLVLVDEIGRGTSYEYGLAIAGAFLEELCTKNCYGIFSTHLHRLLDLNLSLKNCTLKYLKYTVVQSSAGIPEFVWNYRVENGYCSESYALDMARHLGLPEPIARRAEELLTDINELTHKKTQDS